MNIVWDSSCCVAETGDLELKALLQAGHMFWKLLSALTLVNFGGSEIDRAALSRYLSEAVFFPTALLPSQSLSWEPESVDSAKATLTHQGVSVSAIFHFNELGQVTHLESNDRPRWEKILMSTPD